MSDKKKTIRSILVFILLIALTFYIVLKNQNVANIHEAIKLVDGRFLLIGIGFMLVYYLCEAINLHRTLKILGEKSSLLNDLKYVFIGAFFSAITPAASGGQPAQIYYMHKDKLNIANSTLALLILLCSFNIVTVGLASVSFIFNFQSLTQPMQILFVIGLILNITLLTFLLIGVFSKNLSRTLIGIMIKVLKFFKVKNLKEREKKLIEGLKKYHDSAKYIKEHKWIMAKTVMLTLVQMCALFSVSYWVYRSFGFNAHNIFRMISLQAVLYATVCTMPLPGSVGISEGSFLGIYAGIYPEALLGTAMILHRGITFYLFVIISSIVVLASSFNFKKNNKNNDKKMLLNEEKDNEKVV